jgi:hypothetical protein
VTAEFWCGKEGGPAKSSAEIVTGNHSVHLLATSNLLRATPRAQRDETFGDPRPYTNLISNTVLISHRAPKIEKDLARNQVGSTFQFPAGRAGTSSLHVCRNISSIRYYPSQFYVHDDISPIFLRDFYIRQWHSCLSCLGVLDDGIL